MKPTSRVRVYLLPLECTSHRICLDSYNQNLLRQRFHHPDDTATGPSSNVTLKKQSLRGKLQDRKPRADHHSHKDARKTGKLNKVYPCHICGASLRSSDGLKYHIKRIHRGHHLKHECAHCGKAYTKKANLSQHIAIHLDTERYVCEICGKKNNSYSALYNHRQKHTGSSNQSFTCDQCSRIFRTKQALRRHFHSHERIDKPLACDLCGKRFRHPSILEIHLNSHSDKRNFKCDSCGALSKCKTSLADHIRHVHGDKEHKCPHCGKLFSRKSALTKHLPTHTGARAFKCLICLKSFNSSSNLSHHRTIHRPDKLFKCKICNMSFKQKGGLQQHLKTHEEKNFECQECNQWFRLNATLRRHIKLIHQDTVKSFTCSLCEKSFKLKANLKEHIIGVHSSGTFPCQYCGATFTSPGGVNQHLRNSCKVYQP